MSVRIQLDEHSPNHYTNLDYISGRVILSCQHEEQVTTVTVKLEGESYTQLLRPDLLNEYKNNRRDRERWCKENHKILYKIAQVFPSHAGGNSVDNALLGVGMNYTLPPGQHVWPFRFRLPVNNVCASPEMQGVGASLSFGGLSLSELPGQMAYRHTVKTLPPTMNGFPEEAEIRYFVKVTVQRPGIFRENRRSQVPFRFIPIEPPRPAITGQETYARRAHTFVKGPSPHTIKRKPSMFATTKDAPKSSLSDTPPSLSVDARLPNPAILTCMRPIPLRLLVKKQADSPEHVFLMNLQVELLCSTTIRAQEVEQTRQGAWIIMTKANMHMPISKPDDQIGDEMVVDGSGLWDTLPLPPGVLPTFQTCNLNRQYLLEVKVGLGYGAAGGDVNPQSIVHLPLRFPVQVYSGIAPPLELSEGARPPSQGVPSSVNGPPAAMSRPPNLPARPSVAPVGYDPAYPPQLRPGDLGDGEDAPPPSYEDAIAEGSNPIQPQAHGVAVNNNSNLTAGRGDVGFAGGVGGAFGSRVDSKS